MAASLLFIFLLQYNWFSNTTPNYQARLKKVGTPTPTLDTNAIKAIKPVPAQKPANNVQSKKARQKNTVTTKTAIEIKTTNQIARNNKEQASTPLSSENTIKTIPKAKVAARKKIEPIIGIAYKEEIKVKIQKSIPIQFEFGKQQNNNSTVDNTTFSVLKTTLN